MASCYMDLQMEKWEGGRYSIYAGEWPEAFNDRYL